MKATRSLLIALLLFPALAYFTYDGSPYAERNGSSSSWVNWQLDVRMAADLALTQADFVAVQDTLHYYSQQLLGGLEQANYDLGMQFCCGEELLAAGGQGLMYWKGVVHCEKRGDHARLVSQLLSSPYLKYKGSELNMQGQLVAVVDARLPIPDAEGGFIELRDARILMESKLL